MTKGLVLIALFLLVGCSGPKVVATFQAPQFQLAALQGQRAAVWPLAKATLDVDTTRAMGADYPSLDQFLDAFSVTFSSRLVGLMQYEGISSDQVQKTLAAEPSTRPLLDPDQLLGGQNATNRFATPTAPSRLASLAQLPLLKGMRYAIIPRDLVMGRNITTVPGMSTLQSDGKGGATFVTTPDSSSALTGGNLRVTIIDLDTLAIVWDGTIFASASSGWMQGTAFRQVGDGLVVNFLNQILGL